MAKTRVRTQLSDVGSWHLSLTQIYSLLSRVSSVDRRVVFVLFQY